jgi:hypothetical protein
MWKGGAGDLDRADQAGVNLMAGLFVADLLTSAKVTVSRGLHDDIDTTQGAGHELHAQHGEHRVEALIRERQRLGSSSRTRSRPVPRAPAKAAEMAAFRGAGGDIEHIDPGSMSALSTAARPT